MCAVDTSFKTTRFKDDAGIKKFVNTASDSGILSIFKFKLKFNTAYSYLHVLPAPEATALYGTLQMFDYYYYYYYIQFLLTLVYSQLHHM